MVFFLYMYQTKRRRLCSNVNCFSEVCSKMSWRQTGLESNGWWGSCYWTPRHSPDTCSLELVNMFHMKQCPLPITSCLIPDIFLILDKYKEVKIHFGLKATKQHSCSYQMQEGQLVKTKINVDCVKAYIKYIKAKWKKLETNEKEERRWPSCTRLRLLINVPSSATLDES